MLIGQRLAEELVVCAEIVERHTSLRNARSATRLEYVHRLARKPLRDPPLHRSASQPVVLESRKAGQIVEAAGLLSRIPAELPRVFQPERGPGSRIEMPGDDLADVRVERS